MNVAHVFPEKKVIMVGSSRVKPALFLDLDGTVRYSLSGDFINTPEDIALFEDAESKIWEYRNNDYLVFGVTNQGGVAFGIKTPKDNDAELDKTISLFNKNPFHGIQACFHHEKGKIEPYNNRSLLRKPDIGMLVLCEIDAFKAGYTINWEYSLFVGDRPEDQQCAKNAGIAFMWADKFFPRRKTLNVSRCDQCDAYIGHLSTAGVTVEMRGLKFCDDICAEGWSEPNNT